MSGFRLLGVLCFLLACHASEPAHETVSSPLRVVSLNPSLTSILIELDAGDSLVGIDDVSAAQQPALAHLPRVGGLFNPSLEAVVAVEPDVVLLVPSVEQRDFRARLEAIGIPVESFDNIRLEQVLENIARLGELVAREADAARRIEAIHAVRQAAERLTAAARHPKTLVVLQRDPVFVVGSGGFIDELLRAAGARNLGAAFAEPYPQVAVEWLVDAGPEVLIDMTDEPGDPLEFWSRWPAIPAVAARRVVHLDPRIVTLPGPHLDRAVRALVEVLHGPRLAARLSPP
jgi:iron complex transport system substrate-binding protein